MYRFFALYLCFLFSGMAFAAAETPSPLWNQFRGPNGAGVADSCSPPVKIDVSRPAWNSPLPPGHSSPVLWADRIFLTGFDGKRLVTLALDRNSGKVLWKRLAPEVSLAHLHPANSPASSTPCVDKEGVYVYFGSYGLLCYDHDGRQRWNKEIPTPKNLYGVSTSPIVYEKLLVLVVDDDRNLTGSALSRSKIIAMKKTTGKLVWETPRPFNRSGWSTPMVWKHNKGTELVVSGNGRVYGYNIRGGAEKWYVKGFQRETISLPVSGDGMVYVSASMRGGRGDEKLDPEPFWRAILKFDQNGDDQVERSEITEDFTIPFRPELPPGHPGFGMPLSEDLASRKEQQERIFASHDKDEDGFITKEEYIADLSPGTGKPNLTAIRPGGKGNVTDTHVVWNLRRGIPEVPSPLFYKNRLYYVRDGGLLSVVDAKTGDIVYQEKTGAPGHYAASPVMVHDHLYLISEKGIVTVLKSGDVFAIVHQTDLQSRVHATPAIDMDSLYIRIEDSLIAFR